MYENDTHVIVIQSNQLVSITQSINGMAVDMESIAQKDVADKDSLKAYIASVDILMNTISSQQVLLQQALDNLAKKLAG